MRAAIPVNAGATASTLARGAALARGAGGLVGLDWACGGSGTRLTPRSQPARASEPICVVSQIPTRSDYPPFGRSETPAINKTLRRPAMTKGGHTSAARAGDGWLCVDVALPALFALFIKFIQRGQRRCTVTARRDVCRAASAPNENLPLLRAVSAGDVPFAQKTM